MKQFDIQISARLFSHKNHVMFHFANAGYIIHLKTCQAVTLQVDTQSFALCNHGIEKNEGSGKVVILEKEGN